MTVVDASVAVKLLLPEPGSEQAIALFDSTPYLVAPSLIRVEVGNALVRACRSGRLGEPPARELHRQWDVLAEDQIELVPTAELYARAVNLAYRLKHPLPDCLYLALAIERLMPLVTADRTLLERGAVVHPGVRLLGVAA